ncbi:MAG: PIG-L family deacetylase [Bacteroidales bacterium]
MKRINYLYLSILAIILTACSPSLNSIKKFAATEKYPVDDYLDTVTIKRALIIVAHDDDDCAMSGTISKLTAGGWDILNLSLTTHHAEAGINNHPSEVICNGHEEILTDGIYRIDTTSGDKKYMPFPKTEFDKIYLKDKISKAVIKQINEFQPTVIFTLDNEIGGYGHPDHVFMSQLILDLAEADSIHPQRIYQSVFTNHMEHEIVEVWLDARLKKWGYPNMYTMAKQIYGVSGMPDPNIEINIKSQAELKMKYLLSYDDEARKSFRKFIPYYEEFDAKEYFGIFDREFFRIIELNQKNEL